MKEKIKIILTDDSRQFIEGLKTILLNSKNYIVIDECFNGKELYESPQLPKADLILSDIEMPEMNGIEAARLINFEHPNLPMVALTMHIEKVFLEDLITVGFKGFIHKPDVAKNLLKVIDEVLKNNFVFPDNLRIKK